MEVVIASRHQQADGIISLALAPVGAGALPTFEAGAHVDVDVAPGVMRQYSLCSDPADNRRYEIAVLLEPESRGGSAGVHRTFVVGRTIRIGRPRNNFPLTAAAKRSLLLAGGIGITPLLSMMHDLERRHADFAVHYCARSRARAAFLGRLNGAAFAAKVKLHFDDGPDAQRFNASDVLCRHDEGMHLYVCGPRGFIDHILDEASRAGWPSNCIHVEHFSAAPAAEGEGFTVVARRSGVTVDVMSGQTIAGALAAAGIAIDLSCQQGICGSCLVDVVDGVPDHRDHYLDAREKASNRQMTVCCSRALTKRLVLDV